ncbi:MAG: hypothetical protein A2Y10_07220 [Planctomycetes bacterium GWF2_41_51]|nr:MAG: hypothetical protein A2Y10_07220 [Planctomycetes bacterium GWF2_41_51]HBG28519.1 hypothetical protein [Phycisphaerales bacterium]
MPAEDFLSGVYPCNSRGRQPHRLIPPFDYGINSIVQLRLIFIISSIGIFLIGFELFILQKTIKVFNLIQNPFSSFYPII